MGVKGLWKLLDGTGRPVSLEALEGKVLAVDVSVWLNMAIKGMRDYHGHASQTAHLISLFNRICKLLYHGIKPVFVFDGQAPQLKQRTVQERKERKHTNAHESKKASEKILQNYLKKKLLEEVTGKAEKSNESQDEAAEDELLIKHRKAKSQDEDIYNLPPLSKSLNTIEDDEMEEELQMRAELQSEFHDNAGHMDVAGIFHMDVESKDFESLPSDVQYELLQDLHEMRKRQRTRIEVMPEESKSFSSYQLDGLLAKHKITKKMEHVQNKMSKENLAAHSSISGIDNELMKGSTVIARTLVSDSKSHYVWMKKNNESKPSENHNKSLKRIGSTQLHIPKSSLLEKPKSMRSAENKARQTDQSMLVLQTEHTERCQDSTFSKSDELTKNNEGNIPFQTTCNLESKHSTELIETTTSESKILDPEGKLSKIPGSNKVYEDIEPTSTADSSVNDYNIPVSSILYTSEYAQSQSSNLIAQEDHSTTNNSLQAEEAITNKALQLSDEECDKSQSESLPPITMTERSAETPSSESSHNLKSNKFTELGKKNLSKLSSPLPNVEPLKEVCSKGQPHEVKIHSVKLPNKEPMQSLSESQPVMKSTADNVEKHTMCESAENPALNIDMSNIGIETEYKGTKISLNHNDVNSSDDEFVDVPESSIKFHPESLEVSSQDDKLDKDTIGQSTDDDSAVNPWEGVDVQNLKNFSKELDQQSIELKKLMQAKERAAKDLSQSAQLECQDLLKLFGLPYIVSPQEAEAQCATLEQIGLTEGTITEDSDIWLFGGKYVVKDMFSSSKDPSAYHASDIETLLGLNRDRLICIALCSGSDYTTGIHGVGPVTAMEILKEFPGEGLEGLQKLKEWWKGVVTSIKIAVPTETKIKSQLRRVDLQKSFPSQAVYKAYMEPVVNTDDKKFEWGLPDLDELRMFATETIGWTRQKVDEVLLPVLKKMGQRRAAQTKVTKFFPVMHHMNSKRKSRRVMRAAAVLTGKSQVPEHANSTRSQKAITRKRGTCVKTLQPSGPVLSESSSDSS